ncbi:MAG: domain S-box [Verrucomicrobiaceae bacterium]|nr:domain S-box [Verrucomicrobiaceae bacterium]
MKPIFEVRSLFGLMAFVLVVSIGMAYWSAQVSADLTAESHKREVFIGRMDMLLSSMKDAETGQRGFLLTGKDSYLKPFNDSVTQAPAHLAQLHQMAKEGRPGAEQEISTLQELADAKMQELRQTVDLRRSTGLAAALVRVNQDDGKVMLDKMRERVAHLKEAENQRISVVASRAHLAGLARNITFASSLLLNLGFLLWAYRKITRGIEQREGAAQEVRRQREVLATTLSSIGDAVIIADTATRITFLNGVAEELTGWTMVEAIGQPCATVFNIINETTRAVVESPVDKVLQTGVIIGLANHTLLVRKDGSEVPIDDSGAPIREAGGEVRGVVLVFRDFSAHKATERALREAKEEVERASRGKDLFLAALSHELRTPLSPVLAILSEWDGDTTFPPALKADLTMIRRNVALEARLIDDLLDLTHIERGTLSLNLETVNLHDLAESTLTIYEADIHAKALDVRLELAATKPWVLGDPARLQQVLWNIVGNAVKFTPTNGTLILHSYHPTADTVQMRVTDTGIGISAETMENLFAPFYQGHREDGRKFGGLGLGMAISKALIDQHKGRIMAESRGDSHGATFSLVLPVAGHGPLLPASHAEGRNVLPPLFLLLVEDHPDTARSLSALLGKRGHNVGLAGSVKEGVAFLRRQPVDLIISDIGLPDGTGIDFIRQTREFCQTPAIALSGHGMKDDVERCLAAGFTSHLTKPASIQQLVQEMTRVMALNPPSVVANGTHGNIAKVHG